MKTRVTFRLEPDLAAALRELPNQTHFVEGALREALGRTCPSCGGSGRVPRRPLRVDDVRASGLPALSPEAGARLKEVVRLGRDLAATRVSVSPAPDAGPPRFVLARDRDVLLRGRLEH